MDDAFVRLARLPARLRVAAEPEVLMDAQIREGPAPFRDVRDPGARHAFGGAGDRPPGEVDGAAPPDCPRDCPQGGGLAGPVGAEHCD